MQKLVDHIVDFIHKVLTKFGIGEQMRYSIVRYSFNTGWMFAEKVLFMVVAFFVGIYVARYLGPEKYGVLNYAISFVAIFKVMASLGLDGIITREMVKSKYDEDLILGTSFLIKLFGSISAIVIILILIQFISAEFKTKLLIIIIASGIIFNSFGVAQFYFEANVKSKYNAMGASVAIILSSAFKLLLVLYQADLVWFAFSYMTEITIQSITSIIFYKTFAKSRKRWSFSFNLAKSFIKDSWPLLFAGFATMLYLQIDQIMLKEMLGATAVGNYSAAVKLSEIWYIIPSVIVSSLFPALVKEHEAGEKYELRLKQLFLLLARIAIFIAIPISITSSIIIEKLFGLDYIKAAPVLSIHIWSGLFIFMNLVVAKWHIVENQSKLYMLRTALGALLNIFLNLILIPRYEIIGAALASLVSYSFIAYFSCLIFKPMRKIFVLQTRALICVIPFNLLMKRK